MSRNLTEALDIALQANLVRPALFVELQTAGGTVFAWSGRGEVTFGGNTFQGLGSLMVVEPAQETSELKATGARIGLSGIPSDLLSLALQSVRQGLPARIWLGAMEVTYRDGGSVDDVADVDAVTVWDEVGLEGADGGGWVPADLIADPYLIFEGLTDVPEITDGGETATIMISAESRFADLDRPRVRRYTHEDQQRIYPGDQGFAQVPMLQDTQILFGRG